MVGEEELKVVDLARLCERSFFFFFFIIIFGIEFWFRVFDFFGFLEISLSLIELSCT